MFVYLIPECAEDMNILQTW